MVTVVSFTLMGIEGIADEIEMPFGYDYYDLPLGEPRRSSSWTQELTLPLPPIDRMCNEVKAEIQYTINRLPEGHETVDFD